MEMKLFPSAFSHDSILLLISVAIHQKPKQSTNNFVTCSGFIQSTKTMYCEYFKTFYLIPIDVTREGGGDQQ